MSRLREFARLANDLTRVTLGVAPNPTNANNFEGLTGTNVLVAMSDSGVDTSHPDLTNRITADTPGGLVDPNGHGTHVAGTILGSGVMSSTVTNASGSVSNANFRGMAPQAKLYVIGTGISTGWEAGGGAPVSDQYVQEQAGQSGAPILNLSWTYGNSGYDLAAASYDWAVRDSLSAVPGMQPLLIVVSAGNNGGGTDDGFNGNPDSILSPATAKNVITVGALEQLRNITNLVVDAGGTPTRTFSPEATAPTKWPPIPAEAMWASGSKAPLGALNPT